MMALTVCLLLWLVSVVANINWQLILREFLFLYVVSHILLAVKDVSVS